MTKKKNGSRFDDLIGAVRCREPTETSKLPLLCHSPRIRIKKKELQISCIVGRAMDIELQILKHLPRDAQPKVSFIDKYCNGYKELFSEVRSYECFKYLHLGIISSIPKKSLPEIAKVVGINSAQSLHHFIAKSPWSVSSLRTRRLGTILTALKGNSITVVIDEAGDRKKGKKTDYVARQYLGSIDKIDSGIVCVNAYGIYQDISFPLLFKVFKPQGTLKSEENYQTKIKLASAIITELIDFGFSIELVFF
jgi:SRSO17 transposase